MSNITYHTSTDRSRLALCVCGPNNSVSWHYVMMYLLYVASICFRPHKEMNETKISGPKAKLGRHFCSIIMVFCKGSMRNRKGCCTFLEPQGLEVYRVPRVVWSELKSNQTVDLCVSSHEFSWTQLTCEKPVSASTYILHSSFEVCSTSSRFN